MPFDLATFGEGQLRLTVPHGARLADLRTVQVCAAGSEANVAGLLAQLGRATAWASLLPQGPLGDRILSEYRSAGVDLSLVVRPPHGRIATYYLEPSAGGLPARVVYDRLGTPMRDIVPADLDWDALLDTRCLFVTGITAALTPQTAEVIHHAVDEAERRDVRVVLDVNHRATLWTEDEAERVLRPLLGRTWALFCSRRDASAIFAVDGDGPDVARRLRASSSAEHVVVSDGARAVSYSGSTGDLQMPVDPVPVRDRPGAGDAFVAGVLHGLLDGRVEQGLAWGIRAAAIALGHDGDLTRIDPSDLVAASGADIHR